MKEKEQLVSVSLIQSTSGVVVDFSPELQCADQLFEDVRLFLELYEEEDGYRVCLDKEELLKFIKQQTTLPPLTSSSRRVLTSLAGGCLEYCTECS